MKNKNIIIHGNKVSLRLITVNDIPQYYKSGFESVDEEVQRCTGTKHTPTQEEISTYVQRIVRDDTRYDFLILNKEGQIIGESVINEINSYTKCANFRICLFKSQDCERGIGSEVIPKTIQFGFETLNLHRIDLEVFSFNKRAYKAYRRAGFREEGRRREAEFIDGKYCDVIIMGILHHEYAKRNYPIG